MVFSTNFVVQNFELENSRQVNRLTTDEEPTPVIGGIESIVVRADAIADMLGVGGLFNGTINNDTLTGGIGNDTLEGLDGNDFLSGRAGNDTIDGGNGDDRLFGETGSDLLNGNDGNDRLIGLAGFDTLNGGDGDDFLDGRFNIDILHGDAGNDTLIGGAGADRLFGGADNDTLQGDDGDDSLFGQTGNDLLLGGAGNDRLIGLAGFDTLEGGDGNDFLDGRFNLDFLFGEAGHDTLIGGAGADRLFGGVGNDILQGDDGDDRLFGETGNDLLLGGVGNDLLVGLAGFDTLNGGVGNDTLEGRFNADRFVFEDDFGNDIITDFDHQNPIEKIDLTQISRFNNFADVLANTSDNLDGNAVITDGLNTITLLDVSTADLDADDFILRDAPRAVDDSVNTTADSALTIDIATLLANDSASSSQITSNATLLSIDTNASAGSAVIENGQIIYNPDGQFESLGTGETATDSFTYTITDAEGIRSTAIVNITITGVNEAPVGADDSATTDEDTTVIIDVLANDSDIDGDALIVTQVTNGNNGTVTINGDGTLTYSPDANFNGVDSFTYTLTDGEFTSDHTVNVTVNPVNDTPQATLTFTLQTNENGAPITITPDTLGAVDAEGDPISLFFFGTSQQPVTIAPLTGVELFDVFSTNPDGTITIDIGDRFAGLGANEADRFSFNLALNDGIANSELQEVTIVIQGINEAPIAGNETASVSEDGMLALNLLENDSDPNNDPITILTVGGTVPGIPFEVTSTGGRQVNAQVNGLGVLQLTPGDNFQSLAAGETDTIEIVYTIQDGNGGTADATATITVTGENDVPIGVNDNTTANDPSFQAEIGETLSVNLLSNDIDVDTNDTLQIISIGFTGIPQMPLVDGMLNFDFTTSFSNRTGTAVINQDGTITIDTTSGTIQNLVDGTDVLQLTYTAVDGSGAQTSGTALLQFFLNSNSRPVIPGPQVFNVTENGVTDFMVSVIDADVSDTISLSLINTELEQFITINGDGSLSFDPGDSFEFLTQGETLDLTVGLFAEDNSNALNARSFGANITLTITGALDAPDAVDDAFTISENGTSFFGILENDIFRDRGDITFSLDGADTDGLLTISTQGGREVTLRVDGNGISADTSTNFDELTAGETDSFTFTYTAETEFSGNDTATVTVTINGENDIPEIVTPLTPVVDLGSEALSIFISEEFSRTPGTPSVTLRLLDDTQDTITVTASDLFVTDLEGETLTLQLVGLPEQSDRGLVFDESTVTINGDGNLSINLQDQFISLPDAGGVADEIQFGVKVSDGNELSEILPISLIIRGTTNESTIVDDSFTITDVFTGIVGNVFANDTFIDQPVAGDPQSLITAVGLTIDTTTFPVAVPQSEVFEVTSVGGRVVQLSLDPLSGDISLINNPFDSLSRDETDTITFEHTTIRGRSNSDFTTISEVTETHTSTTTLTIQGTNSAPVLGDIVILADVSNGPVTVELSAFDADGDDLQFGFVLVDDTPTGSAGFDFNALSNALTLDQDAGTITIDPAQISSSILPVGGVIDVLYRVSPFDGQDFDIADVRVIISNGAILGGSAFVSGEDDGLIRIGDITTISDSSIEFGQPSRGSVIDNGDGTFDFDPGNAFQFLDDGETSIITIPTTVTVSGITEQRETVITILGSDDEPVTLQQNFESTSDNQSMFGVNLIAEIIGNDNSQSANDVIDDLFGTDFPFDLPVDGETFVFEPDIPFLGVSFNEQANISLFGGQGPVFRTVTQVVGEVFSFFGISSVFETFTELVSAAVPSVNLIGSLEGRVGLQPSFTLTTGDVDSRLGGTLGFTAPAQVVVGETVTLESFVTFDDGVVFSTQSPNLNFALDIIFDVDADAAIDVAGLGRIDLFDIDVDETFPLFSFGGSNADFTFEFPEGTGSLFAQFPIIETESDALFPLGLSASSSSRNPSDILSVSGPSLEFLLSDDGRDPGVFFEANADIDGIASLFAQGLPPLGFDENFSIAGVSGRAAFDILDVDLIGSLLLAQDFNFQLGDIQAEIVLENGDRFAFTPGDDVSFIVPENFDTNGNGILDFTTEFNFNGDPFEETVGALFRNTTSIDAALDLVLRAFTGFVDLDLPVVGNLRTNISLFESTFNIASGTLFDLFDEQFALTGFEDEMLDFGLNISVENQFDMMM